MPRTCGSGSELSVSRRASYRSDAYTPYSTALIYPSNFDLSTLEIPPKEASPTEMKEKMDEEDKTQEAEEEETAEGESMIGATPAKYGSW